MADRFIKSKLFYDYLHDPSALIGSGIMILFFTAALLAPVISPQNPYDLTAVSLGDYLTPPIWEEGGHAPFLLGTDDQGRDILSTILYGCRTSLLVAFGVVVIAGGGGGIPIIIEENGDFEGLDVVVDKDLTASLIGRTAGADTLIIATDIRKVALNFNTPQQRDLDRLTLGEAQRYLAEGHFPEGSMGPKIEASIDFLRSGGDRVIIAAPDRIGEALAGRAGTTIVRG